MATILIDLPPGLLARVRIQARNAGTTINEVMIRYLETYAAHGHPQAAGARAVNASKTAEERSASARKAARARWLAEMKGTIAYGDGEPD